MPSQSNKEKDNLHRSPSVLKLLGKKLLSSNKHQEPQYTVISSGNSIAPMRKRTTSPHVPVPSGNTPQGNLRPKRVNTHGDVGSSSNQYPAADNEKNNESVSRHRSPSLVSRLRGSKEGSNIHPVKSAVSLADLTAHNTNPFIMTPLHPDKEGSKDDLSVLHKRSTGGEIHRAKSTNGKKKTGTPHTHHLATVSRSKSFMGHPTNNATSTNLTNNSHNNSSVFNLPAEKVVYNPYGINSRPGTAFGNENGKDDLSFYLHDGNAKIRMLPLPIADPNTFLPEEMKQYSIHLTDNFIFDTDNKPIGSGGSSEVRKIRSSYRQKDVYALKKLNMIYNETPEKFYKRCSKEFIIAKYLSHNIHVMPTFLLVKVPTTTYTTRGWGFIMELGVKDLFELIERTGWKSVPISEKWCLFKQIAQGVKFCHDNGIAHRDLKPENVLITKDGICKLTDFGISDWYHTDPHDFNSPTKKCEGMIGSPPFAPPEVMYWDSKKHYPERFQKPYDPLAMDCYALGMILFTLINGIVPFIESCNSDARFREFETSYGNYIVHQNPHFRDKHHYKPGPGGEFSLARNFKSTNGTRIAWRLSDPNPETRYTMQELFDDPWFDAVETCVNADDDSYLSTRVPEIKKSSTNDGSFFLNDHENSTDDIASTKSMTLKSPVAQHSSNPFPILPSQQNTPVANSPPATIAGTNLSSSPTPNGPQTTRVKPRSMVEIATSPMKTTKNVVKGGHVLVKKSSGKLLKGGSSLITCDTLSSSKNSSNEKIKSPSTPPVSNLNNNSNSGSSKDVLFSVPETEIDTEPELPQGNVVTDGPKKKNVSIPTEVTTEEQVSNNVDSVLEEPTPGSTIYNENKDNDEDTTTTRATEQENTKKLDNIITTGMNNLSLKSPGSTGSIISGGSGNSHTPLNGGLPTSSASSIRSSQTPKKKLVIHHHLDVPSSVTSGTSMTLRSLMSG